MGHKNKGAGLMEYEKGGGACVGNGENPMQMLFSATFVEGNPWQRSEEDGGRRRGKGAGSRLKGAGL